MPAGGKDNAPTKQSTATMYQISTNTNNPDTGEYSDQELLDLVNYFEVSRVELKNVGKRFFAMNIERFFIWISLACGFLTCTTHP